MEILLAGVVWFVVGTVVAVVFGKVASSGQPDEGVEPSPRLPLPRAAEGAAAPVAGKPLADAPVGAAA